MNWYAYAGNNPVVSVDPEGLRFRIVAQGGISPRDAEALSAQPRQYLEASPLAALLLGIMDADPDTIYGIVVDEGCETGYNPGLNGAFWAPHQALRFPGGARSPALGLLHELGHAYLAHTLPWLFALLKAQPVSGYDNFNELVTILGVEDTSALWLGEDLRFTHGGGQYFWVGSPMPTGP
jgi:hypothetical protein